MLRKLTAPILFILRIIPAKKDSETYPKKTAMTHYPKKFFRKDMLTTVKLKMPLRVVAHFLSSESFLFSEKFFLFNFVFPVASINIQSHIHEKKYPRNLVKFYIYENKYPKYINYSGLIIINTPRIPLS